MTKNKVKQEINLVSLIEKYQNEDASRAYLEELRWPDGVACPHCGSKSISRVLERGQYDCNSCRYQFSVTSGTIFHDTHLPLWKWFLAAYLMVESKKGISANQMKRTLDIKSYRTAWYLCHRIRAAMMTENKKLSGTVEVDETWVGGKKKDVGHGYKGNKVLAVGAVERNGDIILEAIKHADSDTLLKFIQEHTAEIEAIYTDELPAYKALDKKGIKHEHGQP